MNYRFAACATLVLCFCLVLSVRVMAQAQPSSSGQPQSSTEQTRTVTGPQAHGGKDLHPFPVPLRVSGGSVSSAVFSSDGQRILTCDRDGDGAGLRV